MTFTGNYVSCIDDKNIDIAVPDGKLRAKIKAIGGKSTLLSFITSEMVIRLRSEEEKTQILQELVAMEGIYFHHWDHSWPPSSVVELYREKGLINGKIRRVENPGGKNFKIYVV